MAWFKSECGSRVATLVALVAMAIGWVLLKFVEYCRETKHRTLAPSNYWLLEYDVRTGCVLVLGMAGAVAIERFDVALWILCYYFGYGVRSGLP